MSYRSVFVVLAAAAVAGPAVAQPYQLSTLGSFTPASGFGSYGTLAQDAAGNLYGATGDGGANGPGTVFKVVAGPGTDTTLYSSDDGADRGDPYTDLTLGTDGVTLYGTTFAGGAAGNGTVFSLTPVPERRSGWRPSGWWSSGDGPPGGRRPVVPGATFRGVPDEAEERKSRLRDLNSRPPLYESGALPLS